MTVTLGILALLEAQPGKGGELAEFLKEARELAAPGADVPPTTTRRPG